MGMYDRINSSQAGVVRKLFDYSVHVNGRTVEATRIGVDTDVWGNEERKPLSQETITAIINFPPGELPILRFREAGGMSEPVGSSSVFFYDVLPIEAFFQFKDRIERGDIFYFTIDDGGEKKMPVILKVMDPVGSFSTQILWKKFFCSPVTSLSELPEEVAARVLEKIAT